MGEVVLALRGVERDYRGLRPLRVQMLEVRLGETVAVLGLDRAAAEAFVNLASGATLPDAGTVETLGRSTAAIASNDDWVELLEQVGILSERTVLLGEMSVEQNLAMPFSLDILDLAPELQSRVAELAREVGLEPEVLSRPVAGLAPLELARVRLARAIAAGPRLLLAEHPNALVGAADVSALAGDLGRVIAGRQLTAVTLTADVAFARTIARRTLTHNAATGELAPSTKWRRPVS